MTIAFDGVFYDGRTTARRPVRVAVQDNAVTIAGLGGGFEGFAGMGGGTAPLAFARFDVRVDAPVHGVPRRLALPDGSVVETTDRAAVAAAWPAGGALDRAGLRLETSVPLAIGALCATAAVIWFAITVLLPLAADPVARSVSPQVAKTLADQALQVLDASVFKGSELDYPRRNAIEALLHKAATRVGERAKLEFRAMAAPNALALPDGTIVLTDEMVAFAKSDDELLAVLAHELGHVHHRHGMRLILQQSGVAVLMTALAGDAVGMTILAAIIPSALLNARYSRAFELEADDFALELLRKSGRPPQAFADVLRRFAADERTADARDPLARYLSSHPALDERVRRIEAAQ